MRFVGLQVLSSSHAYPIFTQPFIANARMATATEISNYMKSRGFEPTGEDGRFSNGQILLWDIKPKNVLVTNDGTIAVVDAEINTL